MNRIINGDVLRFAAHYKGERFHGVLCDPPYELGFMGKSWDSRGVSFRSETWSAIRSLLLPGAHLLAFGGTRTFHRIAVAIEDAGFEIRDTIGWLYGSGFPKSHNLRDAWQGYGTALKPAWEPVIVARNPLAGTVAANAQKYGCGALNLEASRIGNDKRINRPAANKPGGASLRMSLAGMPNDAVSRNAIGRWPANILHDGSDDIAEVMGDAQRFFYCAKASKAEREEGLESMALRKAGTLNMRTDAYSERNGQTTAPRANHHPTVKPIALTQYLATLIMPPAHVESRLLVPFAGSGSECIGAIRAGWRHVVGVEQNDEYARIARARIEHHSRQSDAEDARSSIAGHCA